MHVRCQIFQNSLKKIRRITLTVWVLERVERKAKQKGKKCKHLFFVLNKYQDMAHVSTSIFQGLFKNIVFRSVASVIKSVMDYLRFFFFHGPYF